MKRQPHANFNIQRRLAKAKKIEAIIGQQRDLKGLKVLEIGTGSGVIAAHIAGVVGTGGSVVAVDVVDQLQVREGFCFTRVMNTQLPFEGESFDIVISNSVIEHVGTQDDQLNHLREIRRVLKPDGLGYLTAPNRWSLLEPHFKLPLLSWLPNHWRSPYVRLVRRGQWYDCEPLSHTGLKKLLNAACLSYVDRTIQAMRVMTRVESPSLPKRMLLEAPGPLLRLLRPVIPTMIFLVKRSNCNVAAGNTSHSRD